MNGEVAPHLKDLVDRGLVRVLDLMVLEKAEDGTLDISELSDLAEGDLGELRAYEAELAMVLSEQDVLDVAETIQPGSVAAVLAMSPDDEEAITHEASILMTRLLFLLFGDDAGLCESGLFTRFVRNRTSEGGSDLGAQLQALFDHSTPRRGAGLASSMRPSAASLM